MYTYKDGVITYSDGSKLSCSILLDKLKRWKEDDPECFTAWLNNNSMTEDGLRQKVEQMFDTLEEKV